MFAFMIFVFTVSSLTHGENIASSPLYQEDNNCLLPSYPEHGRYTVSNHPSATPGERYPYAKLDISCETGYLNNSTITSIFGINVNMLEYRCLWFPGTLGWSWECESIVPSGTLVRPMCRSPANFSLKNLPEMHCRNGTWDYNPNCKQAAYCFHDSEIKLLPASNFKVAVNKLYSEYNDTRDRNSQYSDVDKLIIPLSYRGRASYYEDNIAIVVVKRVFFFHLSVQPVCLDFDNDLDSTQLAEGNSGKTVRWSPVVKRSRLSFLLDVFDLSYLKNEDCNTTLKTDKKRQFLTKDKFCVRRNNETSNDMTYSGSGLAFLESTTQRYYLRGVYTVALKGTDEEPMFLYTSIVKHEHFIKQHL